MHVAQEYSKHELTMLFGTGKRIYTNSLLPFRLRMGQEPRRKFQDGPLLNRVIGLGCKVD